MLVVKLDSVKSSLTRTTFNNLNVFGKSRKKHKPGHTGTTGEARRAEGGSREHAKGRKDAPTQNGGAANPATQDQPNQEETNTRAAKEALPQ